MKQEFQIFVLYVNLFSFSSCSNSDALPDKTQVVTDSTNTPNSTYQKVRYDSSIIEIAIKSVDMVTSDGLFLIPEFKNIYEHGDLYVEDAINFLGESQYNFQQKNQY